MIIEKGSKQYEVKELTHDWAVVAKVGKLTTDIRISKAACPTLENLKNYIQQENIF